MSNALRELEIWNDALTALQLLQIDPHGFGGVWLRAPFGPVRDQWLRQLATTKINTIKLPGSVDLERLLGALICHSRCKPVSCTCNRVCWRRLTGAWFASAWRSGFPRP